MNANPYPIDDFDDLVRFIALVDLGWAVESNPQDTIRIKTNSSLVDYPTLEQIYKHTRYRVTEVMFSTTLDSLILGFNRQDD